MIGIVYFGGSITDSADTAIKVATSAGTIVGQLGFGIIADLLGRKRIVSNSILPLVEMKQFADSDFSL